VQARDLPVDVEELGVVGRLEQIGAEGERVRPAIWMVAASPLSPPTSRALQPSILASHLGGWRR